MTWRPVRCVALLAAVLAGGCAARKTVLTSEDFTARAGGLKKLGVVVAEASILDLQAGGETAPNPAASERCATLVEAAVGRSLAGMGYRTVSLPSTDGGADLVADYLKLREGLLREFSSNAEIIRGLPPLAGAAAASAKEGLDGIVLLGARDLTSLEGRRVRFGDMAVFRIFSDKGVAHADVAVVDRAGSVIYYFRKAGKDCCHLTDEDGVAEVFGELLSGLPPAGGK